MDKNKSNVGKFILWIVVFIISMNLLFSSRSSVNKVTPETTEPTASEATPSYPENPSEMVGNMEFIGCNRDAIVTSPVRFYYYRDVITDQMFLVTTNSNNHTVTPMTNPATGLPMTYSEYQKMEAVKNPPKEGVYIVSNS